ncbi:MAG: heterodisulfide reductase-related iron-sulfur binding cluster [Bradyrhizobium sp.]
MANGAAFEQARRHTCCGAQAGDNGREPEVLESSAFNRVMEAGSSDQYPIVASRPTSSTTNIPKTPNR